MGQTVVAIGLQQTGKTTFLAALWDVLQSGEVSGSLSLERTDGDMQYLNEIRIAWADCKPLGRTSPSGDRAVVMRLRELGKDTAVELAWTDMLGESFERQWTERSWTRRYQTTVESARGLVLFLHPERVIPSALILDALEAVAVLKKGGAPTPKRRRGAKPAAPEPFSARKVPTQVQLVELLQFVDANRGASEDAVNLSVVISAWDLVEGVVHVAPREWLERELPLLWQYLRSNDDRFNARIFGVSAQGCDYGNPEAVEDARRGHSRTSERIRVVEGKTESHDITRPLMWAIDGR